MRGRLSLALLMLCLPGLMTLGTDARATATTHIWAPSTDVQTFNLWHVTSDMYLAVARDAVGGRVPAVTDIGLTVGVVPLRKLNAEIGFDHKSGLGAVDSYPLYGNVKIAIPENAMGGFSPAVAVGVFDVGTERARTDFDVFYGKIAKSLSVNGANLGRLSLGYFSGNGKLLLDGNGEKNNRGSFAAWERTVPEISDKLWICLEYMGTKSLYGSFSVGGSWKFAGNVSLLGGYEVFNDSNLVNTVTVQLDIDI